MKHQQSRAIIWSVLDSLLTNPELAAGVVSSILRDSDLKKADALCVDEALTLSL